MVRLKIKKNVCLESREYLGKRMKHQRKIIEAIASSMNHLEDSLKFNTNKDKEGVMASIWQAAADLEYANFLFSITQDDIRNRSWKLDLRSKQVEIGPLLISTRGLLEEAKNVLDAGKILEAYKKTWMARGYLLKVSEILQKTQKKQNSKRET